MFFPRTGAPVDYTWSLIARSVAYGPLKDAGVKVAKVSPADPHAGENVSALHREADTRANMSSACT